MKIYIACLVYGHLVVHACNEFSTILGIRVFKVKPITKKE